MTSQQIKELKFDLLCSKCPNKKDCLEDCKKYKELNVFTKDKKLK